MNKFVYTIYDLKNKRKVVMKGDAKDIAAELDVHITTIYKAEKNQHLINNRYLIKKK